MPVKHEIVPFYIEKECFGKKVKLLSLLASDFFITKNSISKVLIWLEKAYGIQLNELLKTKIINSGTLLIVLTTTPWSRTGKGWAGNLTYNIYIGVDRSGGQNYDIPTNKNYSDIVDVHTALVSQIISFASR